MLSASEGWRREYDLGDNELEMSRGFSNYKIVGFVSIDREEILDVTRMMCVVVGVVCRVGFI